MCCGGRKSDDAPHFPTLTQSWCQASPITPASLTTEQARFLETSTKQNDKQAKLLLSVQVISTYYTNSLVLTIEPGVDFNIPFFGCGLSSFLAVAGLLRRFISVSRAMP